MRKKEEKPNKKAQVNKFFSNFTQSTINVPGTNAKVYININQASS